jgi:hypothetical protein
MNLRGFARLRNGAFGLLALPLLAVAASGCLQADGTLGAPGAPTQDASASRLPTLLQQLQSNGGAGLEVFGGDQNQVLAAQDTQGKDAGSTATATATATVTSTVAGAKTAGTATPRPEVSTPTPRPGTATPTGTAQATTTPAGTPTPTATVTATPSPSPTASPTPSVPPAEGGGSPPHE